MKVKEAARASLSGMPTAIVELGESLLDDQREGTFTARFDDGGQLYTVVWQYGAEGSSVACTCGKTDCPHQAALLSAFASATSELTASQKSTTPDELPPTHKQTTDSKKSLEIVDAIDTLIIEICAEGIDRASEARDAALEDALHLLSGRDLPDLKRTVATLRRALTSAPPDPRAALRALSMLTAHQSSLKESAHELIANRSRGGAFSSRSTRKEEVRLFEVARRTQRTPFGERRDVSFFLDLDELDIYREVGAAAPGLAPNSLSDGPFPKRLLGNLVAIEDGPDPRRIRLLQFAAAGFAKDSDLDRVLASCETEVVSLYNVFRKNNEMGLRGSPPLVLFAPDAVERPSSNVILLDERGALLPLARKREPELCETVDLLARQGSILAVIGQLVLDTDFLSLLPLTVLVELGSTRSMRRLT